MIRNTTAEWRLSSTAVHAPLHASRYRGRVNSATASSLFCLRLDPGNDVRGIFARIAGRLSDDFAGRIQQNNGWVPFLFDPKFLVEALVLLHQFGGLLLSFREIDFDQDEVFIGVSEKFRPGERLVV